MIEEFIKDLKQQFDKVLENTKKDLSRVRTGRANLALLDGIRVDYYGVPTPLNQVAALTVADPRLITISPWEKRLIPAIEKSISSADLGLTTTNDGKIIRVPIPPLTMERRKELVKHVKRIGEDAKISLRNIRRDVNEKLKKAEGLPEDDMYKGLEKTQEETDKYIKKVDELIAQKEKDLMEG